MTSFNALASEEANSTIASQGPKSSHSGETIIPTEVGKSNDSEDSQDLFPQQLQENYRNGFLHIFGLNGSFSTTINKRLEELEKDSFLQTTMLKYLLKVICTELYPRSLLSPIRGPGWTKTFSTNSIGQIAAAIPDNYALAVEIVNYLNVKLTNYELYLQDGLEHHRAQTTVFSKSREVMTFKYNLASYYPTGILLYRVGDTEFSLHLYFHKDRYAVAFLENNASVKTIWAVHEGCNKYIPKGTPDTMKCIENVILDTTRILTINLDTVYAKLTVNCSMKTSILTLEVFHLEL